MEILANILHLCSYLVSIDAQKLKAIKLIDDHDHNCDDDASKMTGICPDREHYDHANVTLEQFYKMDKRNIQSIILPRRVSNRLMMTIIKECPNVCCAIIGGGVTFDIMAWQLFTNKLAEKLEHLAIDNDITVHDDKWQVIINWTQLIQHLNNLGDLKLTIDTSKEFEMMCLQYQPEKLKYFFVNVVNSDPNRYSPLPSVINNLSKGQGKNIEFLRIGNNGEAIQSDLITTILTLEHIFKFKKLRALNLDVINYVDEHTRSSYKQIARLKNLESLTLKIFDNHEEILKILANSNFKGQLERIRLIGTCLDSNDFGFIANNFINLKSLKLCDCQVVNGDFNESVMHLAKLSFLEDIQISYYDEKFQTENVTGYLSYLHTHKMNKMNFGGTLHDNKVAKVKRARLSQQSPIQFKDVEFLINILAKQLKQLDLVNIPHMNRNHVDYLNNLVKGTNCDLVYELPND